MAKDSSSARHSLPTSRLNYNCIMPELSLEEAEQFRERVLKLSDNLYDLQIKERVMYGALIVTWIVGLYWDIAKLADVPYYVIKIGLDFGIVVMAIGSYIMYLNRRDAEDAYWKLVLGQAYRD